MKQISIMTGQEIAEVCKMFFLLFLIQTMQVIIHSNRLEHMIQMNSYTIVLSSWHILSTPLYRSNLCLHNNWTQEKSVRMNEAKLCNGTEAIDFFSRSWSKPVCLPDNQHDLILNDTPHSAACPECNFIDENGERNGERNCGT